MRDALFGPVRRRRRRRWLPAAIVALWLAAPLLLAGTDALLRRHSSRELAALEQQTRTLRLRLADCADAAEENQALRQALGSREPGWQLSPARVTAYLPDGFVLACGAPPGTPVLDRQGRWAGQVTASAGGLCTVFRGSPAGLAGTAVGLVRDGVLTGLPVPVTLEAGTVVTTPEGLWLGTLAEAPCPDGLTAAAPLTDTADMADWLYFTAQRGG